MFCEKCGAKIEDGIWFCNSCGNSVNCSPVAQPNYTGQPSVPPVYQPPTAYYQPLPVRPVTSFKPASLVVIIISLLLWLATPFMAVNPATLDRQPSALQVITGDVSHIGNLSGSPAFLMAVFSLITLIACFFCVIGKKNTAVRVMAIITDSFMTILATVTMSNWSGRGVGAGYFALVILLMIVCFTSGKKKVPSLPQLQPQQQTPYSTHKPTQSPEYPVDSLQNIEMKTGKKKNVILIPVIILFCLVGVSIVVSLIMSLSNAGRADSLIKDFDEMLRKTYVTPPSLSENFQIKCSSSIKESATDWYLTVNEAIQHPNSVSTGDISISISSDHRAKTYRIFTFDLNRIRNIEDLYGIENMGEAAAFGLIHEIGLIYEKPDSWDYCYFVADSDRSGKTNNASERMKNYNDYVVDNTLNLTFSDMLATDSLLFVFYVNDFAGSNVTGVFVIQGIH